MRSARPSHLALLGAIIFAAGGCGGAPRHSVISTGPDGLRTFAVFREMNGAPILCNPFLTLNRVAGTFEGQAGVGEPVWITSLSGQRFSVVWPEGFSVRFEPAAVLYDDTGKAVARAGAHTELSQTRRDEHAGTFDDPYIASGMLFDGCYPFVQ